MLTNLRLGLIHLLAGKDLQIAVNLSIGMDGAAITFKGANFLFTGARFPTLYPLKLTCLVRFL